MAGARTAARSEAAGPPAVEVLRGYLAAQSTAFLAQLPRLRQGHPEAAHRIRVASRRARSMLRTFRPLLDEEWADELAERLARFTSAVGPERDVEVVRRRLLAGFDALGDQDSGVVRARNLVDRMLQREATAARESTLAVLAGPGFHALADQIALAPAALPGRPAGREPAGQALYPLVRESFEAMERRVRRLPRIDPLDLDGWGAEAGSGFQTESEGLDLDALPVEGPGTEATLIPGSRVGGSSVGARGGDGRGVDGRIADGRTGDRPTGRAGEDRGTGRGADKPAVVRPRAGSAAAKAKAAGTGPGRGAERGRGEPAGTAAPAAEGEQPSPASAEQAQDELWHRLRISAKRGRYAAEVCIPLAGPAAAGYADQLTRLTEALGQQQDAAMASAVLSRAAQTPRIVAPTAFALGRLLGAQRAQIARARWAFPGLWEQVAEPELRSWLG